MKKTKIIKLFTLGIIATALFTACGSNTSSSSSTASSSSPKTIEIGIGNAYKPYCYLDNKGQLQGYDYEVLKAINKKLPQYKFVYNQLEFKNVLLSVQSGKVDVGSHQIEWNPARSKNFLYGDVAIDSYDLRLVVKAGRTDIKSLSDLKGKNVFAYAGSNTAYVLDQYNKKHNNLFNLVLASPADTATIVNNIQNGTWDAELDIERDVEDTNKQFGNKLQIVGGVVAPSNAYEIFNNKDTQIKKDFDKALKELKADGTLAKISNKILGGDFTTPSPIAK